MCITCEIQSSAMEMGKSVWYCDKDKKYKTRLGISHQISHYFEQVGLPEPNQKEFDDKLGELYEQWKAYVKFYLSQSPEERFEYLGFKKWIYEQGKTHQVEKLNKLNEIFLKSKSSDDDDMKELDLADKTMIIVLLSISIIILLATLSGIYIGIKYYFKW